MNGERYAYVLFSKKKQCYVGTTVYPNPLHVEWSDGANMIMTMNGCNTESFTIKCEGFAPEEPLIILSKSYDEVMCYPSKASPQGTVSAGVWPGVIGKYSGQALFAIKRPLTGETRSILFDWRAFY